MSAPAPLPDVQPGAIVSRKLLTTGNGRVIGFAFDEGEQLTEHTSPMQAFVLVHEGTLDISVAGETSRIGPGDSLPLPPSVPHSVRAVSPARMLLVMLPVG